MSLDELREFEQILLDSVSDLVENSASLQVDPSDSVRGHGTIITITPIRSEAPSLQLHVDSTRLVSVTLRHQTMELAERTAEATMSYVLTFVSAVRDGRVKQTQWQDANHWIYRSRVDIVIDGKPQVFRYVDLLKIPVFRRIRETFQGPPY